MNENIILSYDDVFHFVRYENIFKFFNIFKNNGLGKEYGVFIRSVMTPQFYNNLHIKDKNKYDKVFRKTDDEYIKK